MNHFNYFNSGAALLGAFLSWFLGGLDGIMKVLVLLVVIDYLTGILKGFVLKSWASDVGFHGIVKKVCMFLIVGVANVINHELIGDSQALRDAVILFFIANEGLSISENSIALGVPVPEALKERFLSWRKNKN